MRPENSSKLWLNTAWEWSREMTALSSVTPFRPEVIVAWEIPLAAASVLKSASHASKLPVPQGTAAEAGTTNAAKTAQTARAERTIREGSRARTEIDSLLRTDGSIARNVRGKRGQNMASRCRCNEQHATLAPLTEAAAGRQTTGGLDRDYPLAGATRRLCAARRTRPPGNPQPNAAQAAAVAESAADSDRVR